MSIQRFLASAFSRQNLLGCLHPFCLLLLAFGLAAHWRFTMAQTDERSDKNIASEILIWKETTIKNSLLRISNELRLLMDGMGDCTFINGYGLNRSIRGISEEVEEIKKNLTQVEEMIDRIHREQSRSDEHGTE